MKSIAPETSLLYSEIGVYRGIYFVLTIILNIDCVYLLEPPR